MIGLKFFKHLFLSLSIFIVACCFIRKINNKPELTFNYVLDRFEKANITFNFSNHLKEYRESLASTSFEDNDGDMLGQIGSICNNIYQTCKLVFLFAFDTIRAGIEIIVVLLDILGFDMPTFEVVPDGIGGHIAPGTLS